VVAVAGAHRADSLTVMRSVFLAIFLTVALAPSAFGADGISGTWTTGGAEPRIFIFKASAERFAGVACGPCDRPSSVFRIDDGRMLDANRIAFFVTYDVGGPRFKELGAYRERFEGSIRAGQLSLTARPDGRNLPESTVTLTRVVQNYVPDTTNLPPSSLLTVGPDAAPSAIEGRWIYGTTLPQQNLTLKVRGRSVWGVICGPCTPDQVAMIDDGTYDGSTIRFHINHFDTNRFPQPERGVQRNILTGVVTGNVIKFVWVREQAREQTGEMFFVGPIRD